MRKATILIVAALLLMFLGAPASAADMPPLPHAFYGDVTINNSPAPAGTTVSAMGEGVETGTYNPITTTESGKYGSADPLGAKLIVQGDIGDGTAITFYVNGKTTGQTYPFDSGETTELNLSVTIVAPPEVPPEEPTPTIEVSLLGTVVSFRISPTGEILETITATSADGMLTITIPKGTIALDKDGNPLDSLEVAVDESPPDPPEGYAIIGLVYDFGPEGATFDPPITLIFTYDPDDIPAGTEPIVMEWDEDTQEWVELEDYTIDTETNTITAIIKGFSKYSVMTHVPTEREAPTPELYKEEEAVVEEEEQVVEEEEPVVEEEEIVEEEEEVIEEEVPSKPVNWALIGGIIGAVVVVVVLLGYFLWFRRRFD